VRQPSTICEALVVAARRWPEVEAVVGEDGTRWTFQDLFDHSVAAARALVAAGVGPGDRVALWAPNSLRWIAASFGTYLAGGVLVPLNSRYRGEEAGHVLRTSNACVLLTSTDVVGRDLLAELDGVDVPEGMSRVVLEDWDAFLAGGSATTPGEVARRSEAVRPDDRSDIIFTSGTTGAPKGAVLTHGASIRTYVSWCEAVGLRAGDRYLTVYPFFHTAGLKSVVLACVLTGATIVPQAVFDPARVMATVASERITVLPGPPTVFQALLDHPDRGRYDLSGLRLSITGAAVVPVSVIERMRDELEIDDVVTGYGLTETTGTVSMCSHTDPPDVVARTVGRPLDGVEVRIVDEGGVVLRDGEPGEVTVRGFNVMAEYFADPEATAATIDADGWLSTGDVGLIDDGGNLRITDRIKDMFIVGGFNAYPAEIEAQLLQHPDIAQVAVVGLPDERLGEVGAAVVIPVPGHEIDADEVIAWSRERLANFKVPRSVHVVAELPLNPSGKVQKFRLREQLGG
jgi:acyl-CoA synthetase (AMP-forming)/AMP-acid ligase II